MAPAGWTRAVMWVGLITLSVLIVFLGTGAVRVVREIVERSRP